MNARAFTFLQLVYAAARALTVGDLFLRVRYTFSIAFCIMGLQQTKAPAKARAFVCSIK